PCESHTYARNLHPFPTRRPSDLDNPPDPTPVAQFKAGGTMNRLTDRPFGFDPFAGANNISEVIRPVYNQLVRLSNRAGEGVETRSEEHTSELQSHLHIVCRLLSE